MNKENPTLKDIDCLVCWPPGTEGEASERKCLTTLLELCEKYGFGRVPQLAAQIETIWRNPDSRVKFQEMKDNHLKFLEDARKHIEGEGDVQKS